MWKLLSPLLFKWLPWFFKRTFLHIFSFFFVLNLILSHFTVADMYDTFICNETKFLISLCAISVHQSKKENWHQNAFGWFDTYSKHLYSSDEREIKEEK